MADEVHHIHKWLPAEPTVRIKLERGMKGTYAFEISTEDTDSDVALQRIAEVDKKLKDKYVEEVNDG